MAKYEEFNALERIVQKYVKHYQDDYYKYDLDELSSKERSDAYLWIVRTNGTNLIKKEDVATSDVARYYLENRYSIGQDIKFYEIDTETMSPHWIRDINSYYERCVAEHEYNEMYNSDYNDFDYEY